MIERKAPHLKEINLEGKLFERGELEELIGRCRQKWKVVNIRKLEENRREIAEALSMEGILVVGQGVHLQ